MLKHRVKSFHYAIQGIVTGLKDQPNIKIHGFLGLIVIGLGAYFQITSFEWMILILTIGLVLSLEFINTAIEEIVDSFVEGIHPSAKKAKDVSAAAVLIASITALAVGLIIFGQYFVNQFILTFGIE